MKNLDEVRKVAKNYSEMFKKEFNIIFLKDKEKYDFVLDNYFSVERPNVTKIEKVSYKN